MKKTLRLLVLLFALSLTACGDNDETPTTTPASPIVGKWINVGRYVEGSYIEGADCAQIETYTFENEAGVAYEDYCGGQFPANNFPFETNLIGENTYQFIFPNNGGPWLIEQGTINTATIVNGRLHIETFEASEIDNPDRSYYIAVYDKVVEQPQ